MTTGKVVSTFLEGWINGLKLLLSTTKGYPAYSVQASHS